MTTLSLEALSARLEVQSQAIQEVLRALTPMQASQCALGLRDRVAALLAEEPELEPEADEAACAELAAMLRALGERLGC